MDYYEIEKKINQLYDDSIDIFRKLKYATEEERSSLIKLHREKSIEYVKLRELLKETPKPEIKHKTREEEIEEEKAILEALKNEVEKCKKNKDNSSLEILLIEVEQWKQRIKYLEEHPPSPIPKVIRRPYL